jgi:hypothetical protein
MIEPRRDRPRLPPAEEARQWAITLWLIGIACTLGAAIAVILFRRNG